MLNQLSKKLSSTVGLSQRIFLGNLNSMNFGFSKLFVFPIFKQAAAFFCSNLCGQKILTRFLFGFKNRSSSGGRKWMFLWLLRSQELNGIACRKDLGSSPGWENPNCLIVLNFWQFCVETFSSTHFQHST